ncbi:GntR family transcriptional regulator [Amycolatopsis acidicola]|uniref:GntR family transcriptional regulator n=1 Tax=Amycolatopsis acidicola TaxID=2596893 RepID=UPI003C7A9063
MLPGQRLVEADLGEKLGASRGMVRGALMKLVHEGLLEQIPHSGVRVRAITEEEATQTAEACLALQAMCVAKAARMAGEADVERFHRIGVALRQAVTSRNLTEFERAVGEFDDLVLRVSAQNVAGEIVGRLRVRIAHTERKALLRGSALEATALRYEEMIEAIAGGDAERASAALASLVAV